jgi:DNA-binding PadR family transcriptional regulator
LSSQELNPFSYVILALVGRDGAGPHDLVRMMGRGRVYWAAAESHYYSEPKRLERLGYLRSEKRPGKTTPRTHYFLTDRGLEALRAWLAQPAGFPRIQNEAAVHLLAADLVDDAVTVESLRGLKAELAELEARVGVGEEIAGALPHRERYLRLVHALGRETLRVHREWVELVERELARPS